MADEKTFCPSINILMDFHVKPFALSWRDCLLTDIDIGPTSTHWNSSEKYNKTTDTTYIYLHLEKTHTAPLHFWSSLIKTFSMGCNKRKIKHPLTQHREGEDEPSHGKHTALWRNEKSFSWRLDRASSRLTWIISSERHAASKLMAVLNRYPWG